MFDKTLLEQFKTNRQERTGVLYLTFLAVIIIVSYRFSTSRNITKEKTSPELVKVLDEYLSLIHI